MLSIDLSDYEQNTEDIITISSGEDDVIEVGQDPPMIGVYRPPQMVQGLLRPFPINSYSLPYGHYPYQNPSPPVSPPVVYREIPAADVKIPVCGICLDSLTAEINPDTEEPVQTLMTQCGHCFHRHCLDNCPPIKKNTRSRIKMISCPKCRSEVNCSKCIPVYL
ncbi:hypothetical protein P9112_003171 [Eukaryota sp. TZLM1-RC]